MIHEKRALFQKVIFQVSKYYIYDMRSRVRVGSGYSEDFFVVVKVGVHQGSVLGPLLFILMLEALSREFRSGCPWELFYADDLMIRINCSLLKKPIKLFLHQNVSMV